ncbi:hypothetical protein FGO68_gene12720 [Halteria grandinella]|uniref:Uncharacterized protein n=1 Tax=Halteria grandinella TaxID=5974 RepID=A0A8J8NAQ9_HALGN|nr:hypothetical protein FGO68_gene12720 [Halteria grandinella]
MHRADNLAKFRTRLVKRDRRRHRVESPEPVCRPHTSIIARKTFGSTIPIPNFGQFPRLAAYNRHGPYRFLSVNDPFRPRPRSSASLAITAALRHGKIDRISRCALQSRTRLPQVANGHADHPRRSGRMARRRPDAADRGRLGQPRIDTRRSSTHPSSRAGSPPADRRIMVESESRFALGYSQGTIENLVRTTFFR